MSKPCRSVEEVIDAAPIEKVRTAVRVVVELSAYPDGHAGIAVGRFDASAGMRGPKPYQRVAELPLNHREELELAVRGVLDRLFAEAATHD